MSHIDRRIDYVNIGKIFKVIDFPSPGEKCSVPPTCIQIAVIVRRITYYVLAVEDFQQKHSGKTQMKT